MGTRLIAWAQLLRLPNCFSVIADFAAAWLLAHGGNWGSEPRPWLLMAGSVLLYWSGLIFNDVRDRAVDSVERPQRPLPSGRISYRAAVAAGFACLVGGLALGMGYGDPRWAGGLAAAITLYNFVLKGTPLGAPLLGACRFLHILYAGCYEPTARYTATLIQAGGIGMYVFGLSRFAEGEVELSHRPRLLRALFSVNLGLVLVLSLWGQRGSTAILQSLPWLGVTLAANLLGAQAIVHATPQRVQMFVKWAILGLIPLDAAILVGTGQPLWQAAAVCALLAPAALLGRWIYST